MKKALVIGAAGFVGDYLIRELHNNRMDAYATKLPHENFEGESAIVYDLDILDKDAVVDILYEIQIGRAHV